MDEISYPDDGNANCYQVEDKSFWFLRRNELIYWVVKRFAKGGSFIDLGGGNGFVSRRLQDISDLSVIMVEPGKTGCENASRRGVQGVFHGTIDDFVPGKRFDNIGMFDVLEHIPEDLTFLKSLHERLEDDGRIFMTVPAYKFLWSDEDVSAGHYRRYTISKLQGIAFESGFEVYFSSYFFASLIPIIFFLRSIPFILRKKKNRSSSDDHSEGFLATMLSALLKIELGLIMKVGRLPVGASCLVILRKRRAT